MKLLMNTAQPQLTSSILKNWLPLSVWAHTPSMFASSTFQEMGGMTAALALCRLDLTVSYVGMAFSSTPSSTTAATTSSNKERRLLLEFQPSSLPGFARWRYVQAPGGGCERLPVNKQTNTSSKRARRRGRRRRKKLTSHINVLPVWCAIIISNAIIKYISNYTFGAAFMVVAGKKAIISLVTFFLCSCLKHC